MKIIFLDFDGVLMTLRTKIASGNCGWSAARPDPLVLNLLRLVCEHGARMGKPIQIVISSAWRDHEPACLEKLRDSAWGTADTWTWLHEDWRTGSSGSRPREIEEWLAAHPDVTDYRILDDEDHQWTDTQRQKWLQCDPLNGLQAQEMNCLFDWAGLKAFSKACFQPS